MKRILSVLGLVLAVTLFALPGRVEAGLFKNLLTKVDTLMNNYNQNMWMGENSLGNTVIKGVKGEGGNFFQVFDSTVAALQNAQNQALTDLKAVWEAVKDIVLWLPRKIKEIFVKTINKLNAMNQGATVKDRWNNLVSGGNGGGGGGAAVQGGFESEPTPEAPPSGGESGGIENDLASMLSDDGERASMSADEALSFYGAEAERASADAAEAADAPSAPESMEATAEGFGQLIDMSASIEKKEHQTEARKRIRLYYLTSVDTALHKGELSKAAAIIKSGTKLYVGNPDGMEKAMGVIAKRHPKHQAAMTKAVRRIANVARTQGR